MLIYGAHGKSKFFIREKNVLPGSEINPPKHLGSRRGSEGKNQGMRLFSLKTSIIILVWSGQIPKQNTQTMCEHLEFADIPSDQYYFSLWYLGTPHSIQRWSEVK